MVSATTLLCIALFLFGAMDVFKSRIHCMTVLKSSVQGLAVGAKVKYNGVPVGEVTSIKVAPEGQYVYIYMSIFPECLAYQQYGNPALLFEKYISQEIKNGIRCQLRYEGITGTLYQEIIYFDPNSYPLTKPPPLPAGHPLYIPSVAPVLLGGIMDSVAKLSGLDDIFKKVNVALNQINDYLQGPEIKTVLAEMKDISKNINGITSRINNTLTEEEIKKITNNLTKTMFDIQKVANNLNDNLNKSNIPETSAVTRESIRNVAKDLQNTIAYFNGAIQSMKELSDNLNEEPDSLIWGKEGHRVVSPY